MSHDRPPFTFSYGNDPIVATAIHAGHDLRPETAELMTLAEDVRLLEEDPYTDGWTSIAANRVVVHRSRFEVDLNRSEDDAVCFVPEDCWDLDVWRSALAADVHERSLEIHRRFYAELHSMLSRLRETFDEFVVYDLHSYNHRRGGPEAPAADPASNPEINVGTGSLDRERWGHVVDRFITTLRTYDFGGRSLDVRENVKFSGGYLSTWINETFAGRGCALAIEVKKFFMDEHTGKLDDATWREVGKALALTVPAVRAELGRVRS